MRESIETSIRVYDNVMIVLSDASVKVRDQVRCNRMEWKPLEFTYYDIDLIHLGLEQRTARTLVPRNTRRQRLRCAKRLQYDWRNNRGVKMAPERWRQIEELYLWFANIRFADSGLTFISIWSKNRGLCRPSPYSCFVLLRLLFSGHAAVAAENAALRLQLAAFQRQRRRPVLTSLDRLFWAGLSLLWKRWRYPLM
jgi:hypothetical protein